jgi:hypothetical protein
MFSTTTAVNSNTLARLPLWEKVQRICDHTGGGRAVPQKGGFTVRVMDCPMWTAHATALLRASSPHALVSVESCVASLSGFVVVVYERPDPPHLCARVVMTVLVGLVVVLGGTSMMQGMQDEQASTLFAGTARDALGSWWIGQDIIGCTLPNGQCPSGK